MSQMPHAWSKRPWGTVAPPPQDALQYGVTLCPLQKLGRGARRRAGS